MTEPTRDQRAAFERDTDAVETFLAAGMVPMLAAASRGDATNAAAVLYLRQNVSTRAALDGAMQSIRTALEQSRTAWRAGRYDQAVRMASTTRNAALQLYREVERAIPRANEILARAAGKLLAAIPDSIAAGFGFAAAVAIGLLLLAASGGRK